VTQHVAIRPPPAFTPRGLRREDAAAYIGVSPSKFDQWVERGVMPKPKRVDRIVLWDRKALDAAFVVQEDGDPRDQVDGFFG